DAGARRDHSHHRPERRERDHVVERRRDARAAEIVLAAVRPGDQEIERDREAEREEEEAPVAERAPQLEARVRDPTHATSCVSWMKASSRPAPVTSTSRAAGYVESSARSAASESLQESATDAPCLVAVATPGSAASSTSGTSGSVTRIVRVPTRAL